MALPCFTTTWFTSLPECIAHARKHSQSYSREAPARIGWVENSKPVRWYFVPRGSIVPEGFIMALLLPSGLE